MNTNEAIRERHSVRGYEDRRIEEDKIEVLEREIAECNRLGGLDIQLVTDEPRAFDSFMAHYGKFSGVRNYIAMVGKKGEDERIGYYGERLVLLAQKLGLNTCWVALTFSKRKTGCRIGPDGKLFCVIAIGYGKTGGVEHRSRPMSELCRVQGDMPEWFRNGMEAAMLAPTAVNQQKFLFTLDNDTVTAERTGGMYSLVDLGIVKYHFEVGSGKDGLFKL